MMGKTFRLRTHPKNRSTRTIRCAFICARWAPFPLLTREGEVNLARRMERGKLRMQKAISRSAVVQLRAVEICEAIRKETEELDAFVDLGDLEEESAAYTKRRAEVKNDLGGDR